jgi:uncharacterized membrane protein
MLVAFPIGLWIFSLAADIVYRAGGGMAWAATARHTILGGIIGAAMAAFSGLIDLITTKSPSVKKLAIWHMLLNVCALVLFIINLYLRAGAAAGANGPFVLSIIGVILILISGWLGGQMIYVHGEAVEGVCQEK